MTNNIIMKAIDLLNEQDRAKARYDALAEMEILASEVDAADEELGMVENRLMQLMHKHARMFVELAVGAAKPLERA